MKIGLVTPYIFPLPGGVNAHVGYLYENLVIAEIVKGALARGIRPEIYFFRDSHGAEVDVLIREKGELVPVEIKSASTFSTDFLKGLKRFRTLGPAPLAAGAVLYRGHEQFQIQGARIFNPLETQDLWSTLTPPTE